VVKLPSGGERGPTVECMMSLKCWKWPGKKKRYFGLELVWYKTKK
jgi:hypothetical protein